MFAVPGWSVSADKLKDETVATVSSEPVARSKKRKRPNANRTSVTNENVADLWEKVIENRDSDSKRASNKVDGSRNPQDPASSKKSSESKHKAQHERAERKKKKQRLEKSRSQSAPQPDDGKSQDEEWNGFEDELHDEQPKGKKPKKSAAGKDVPVVERTAARNGPGPSGKDANGSQSGKAMSGKSKATGEKTMSPATETTDPRSDGASQTPASAVQPKLTPLQAAMREKLISARFRHLNETLYTRPSAEAFKLFEESPEMFSEYHEGFRRQVGVWPENPVTTYINEIKARARIKPPRPGGYRHRSDRSDERSIVANDRLPLPRDRNGTCTIADLGCGDAALATALQPLQRKLRLDVRSFDLQSPSPLVTRADISNLPLPDGSVDVAIFCLALMGTNWIDFIEEAYRILRWKGELWIADIKSRFTAGSSTGKGKKPAVVAHSVGKRRKATGSTEGDVLEAQLAVEVDGVEDHRQETDVSAFVEVLRRRGFVLRGEPTDAIDLGNKMFVKMYFVKAASPTKGKGVAAINASQLPGKPGKKKFITGDEEDDPVNESAVLKPCVYKLR
ncbi:hypothetical protein VTK73DRAFT_8341 [Phialemonium thermophilum]|uniref:Ribosomal RNA-processing protein 8 n=1 Tax=Phialemonium thermophilum TaxID=223376 RepID=A0ABR3Y7A9_9PEZI